LRRLQPVDPADPALTVLRVPPDRAGDPLLPRDPWLPAGLPVQLLVAHPQRHHVGRAWAEPLGNADHLPPRRPVALLLTDADDQLGPVAHGHVLALPVDIEV